MNWVYNAVDIYLNASTISASSLCSSSIDADVNVLKGEEQCTADCGNPLPRSLAEFEIHYCNRSRVGKIAVDGRVD